MRFIAALSAALLAVTSALAQTAAPAAKGFAVPKGDIAIPEDDVALPRLAEKQSVPCLKALEDGYLVVCHDAAGKERVGFMPNRNEWGQATAKAWVFDSLLPSNTLTVAAPIPLSPGWIPLDRGVRYPVVSSGDTGFKVLFSFAGLSREVPVSRDAADFVPPPKPETDPARIRAQQMSQMVEQSRTQIEELQKRLETAKGNAARLAGLTKELNQIELDKTRIRGEITKADALCKELMSGAPPGQQPALAALARETERMTQQQAEFDAKLQKTQLEAEPLKVLQKQLGPAEAEIEKAKAALRNRHTELEALQKTEQTAEVKQDKESARASMDALARQNADLTGRIQELDLGKISLRNMTDRLDSVQKENQQLRTQLETLTTEILELQKKIKELQKSPQAPAEPAKAPADPAKAAI